MSKNRDISFRLHDAHIILGIRGRAKPNLETRTSLLFALFPQFSSPTVSSRLATFKLSNHLTRSTTDAVLIRPRRLGFNCRSPRSPHCTDHWRRREFMEKINSTELTKVVLQPAGDVGAVLTGVGDIITAAGTLAGAVPVGGAGGTTD